MPTRSLVKSLFVMFFLSAMLIVVGCGEKGSPSNSEGALPENDFILAFAALSSTTVQSDNSDSLTITASVKSASGEAVSAQTVVFSCTGGKLSVPSAKTDDKGEASVSFTAGPLSENGTFAVTCTAGSKSTSMEVKVAGTHVDLDSSSTNLIIDDAQGATLTVRVLDSAGQKIEGAEVAVSVAPEGSVLMTPSVPDNLTNSAGEISYNIIGKVGGTSTLTLSARGASNSQIYTIGSATSIFSIEVPVAISISLSTNQNQIIRVNTPSESGEVLFVTNHGSFDPLNEDVKKSYVNAVNHKAEVTLYATTAGRANIDVLDTANSTLNRDSVDILFSAPAAEASKISVQSTRQVLPVASGTVRPSTEVIARVQNSDGQAVGGALVTFSLKNRAGDESVSPTAVYTDWLGRAVTTFTSGAFNSTGEGVEVVATVLGVSDSVSIRISGTAGSVSIGKGTKIKVDSTDTQYLNPMSVIVTDINGSPVEGAVVTLGVWPIAYIKGIWGKDLEGEWTALFTTEYANEDENRDTILDPVEDTNEDGVLTPHSATVGSIPATVTTDANGTATFDHVYLKDYSRWVRAEMKASVVVQGTETTGTRVYTLPFAKNDAESLGSSPFNHIPEPK